VVAVSTVEDVKGAVVVRGLGVRGTLGFIHQNSNIDLKIFHVIFHLHLDAVALVILATLEFLVPIPGE
jgi:hypothetical protein